MSRLSATLSPLGIYLREMQTTYGIPSDRLLARWLNISASTLSRWLYGGRGISRNSRIKVGTTKAKFMLSAGEIRPEELSQTIKQIVNELLDLQRSRKPLRPLQMCVDEHLSHIASIEVEIIEAIASERRERLIKKDPDRLTH